MSDPMFFMPAVEGLEVPTWFGNFMGTLGTSLDYAFRNLGQQISDPTQISMETQGSGALSLEEIYEFLPVRQTIWPFAGSWAAAATIRGWAICDGSNGTPKIHPAPGDTTKVQRMLRATAYGTDGGTTAGAACHGHTTCLTSAAGGGHGHTDTLCNCNESAHTHAYICDTETNGDHEHDLSAGRTSCDCHCHTLATNCACTPIDGCHCHDSGTLTAVCNDCYGATGCAGTDHCFSQNPHTHAVEGCTQCNTHCHLVQGATCCQDHCHDLCCSSCCDGSHKHGNDGTTGVGCAHTHVIDGDICSASNHSHALGCQVTSSDAHLPQLIDVIWLMKL